MFVKYRCERYAKTVDEVGLSDITPGALGAKAREMLMQAKGVLLDWDGCIAIDNRIQPYVADLIAAHADKIAIVSNNSTHLPADFVDLLITQGITLAPERVFLAGVEALRAVSSVKDARVLLIAAPRMYAYAQQMGIVLDSQDPNVVLLMRDSGFSYAKLEQAANAVKAGARLVAANADRSHPGAGNRIVPETGALLAALLACVDSPHLTWQLIGKPGPLLFEQACAKLGIAADEAVMIGDNPHTDGEGATNAGIPSILIGRDSALGLEDLVEPCLG